MLRQIEKVTAVYFSPCGNGKKIATILANEIGRYMEIPVVYDDFTLPESRIEVREYGPEQIVVFVVPVYAGRVPNKVIPFVQTLFKGNRTMVIPVVTFGNRSFDNGLKELCFELDKKGFLAVGAAAVVAEHSFSNKLAPGRPNEEDNSMLQKFADTLTDKILKSCRLKQAEIKSFDRCPFDINNLYLDIDTIPGQWPAEKYYTPLGIDGQPAKFLKAKPQTTEACDKCGICAQNCPMGSIDMENPKVVDGICIKCQACIKKCPKGAKYFNDEAFLSHVKMLEEHYSKSVENSFFI